MKPKARIPTFLAALGLAVVLSAGASADRAAVRSGAGETEANITRLTAGILAGSQFAHHRIDDELASAFLDRYLEVLDRDRTLFLQSDVDEFAAYRATLANDTRRNGDTRVADVVFDRYLERLGQRVAYINDTLRDATFDFTGQASYALDRENAPRPQDLAVARAHWWQQLRFQYLQLKLDGKAPEEIVKTLGRRATRALQAMQKTSRDAVLEIYLSALAQVYDPHSDYLGREQMEEFAISMNLSLFGIGARLQSEDGHCKIVELLAGGPAARSGLLDPGDRIVAVAQAEGPVVDVVDMPLARIVDLIRGPKGSVVGLTVIPASAGDDSVRKTISLVRDEIRLEDQRARARITDLPAGGGAIVRLGVIELPSFYGDLSEVRGAGANRRASATADVARLLGKLKEENVQGVVLDLRRNGGGSLTESINLTGLFIAKGPVVQTRGFNNDIDVGADTDASVDYDGPLVVLTSRFSASASEILAGALQDYGRAIIVGDGSTFGKGTVQSIVRLAPIMERSGLRHAYDPGALKVTIRKFYRPSGASTQLKGVESDIVLPSPSAMRDIGESTLDNPLPWDTVPPVDYGRVGMVQPYLDTLRSRSAQRVAGASEFDYLRAEIARLKERLESRVVSLNEAERRREIAQLEERKTAYEAAARSLGGPVPVSYEITVSNADLPGLPPPLATANGGAATEARVLEGAEDAPDSELEEESPQRDVILGEAERILADYVDLLARDGVRMARPVESPAGQTPRGS